MKERVKGLTYCYLAVSIFIIKARNFLLIDLQEFIFISFRVGDEKKGSKKLTGHFQSFFFISPEKIA